MSRNIWASWKVSKTGTIWCLMELSIKIMSHGNLKMAMFHIEQMWRGIGPLLSVRGQRGTEARDVQTLSWVKPAAGNRQLRKAHVLWIPNEEVFIVVFCSGLRIYIRIKLAPFLVHFFFHLRFFPVLLKNCQELFLGHLTHQVTQPSRKLLRESVEDPYKPQQRIKKYGIASFVGIRVNWRYYNKTL